MLMNPSRYRIAMSCAGFSLVVLVIELGIPTDDRSIGCAQVPRTDLCLLTVARCPQDLGRLRWKRVRVSLCCLSAAHTSPGDSKRVHRGQGLPVLCFPWRRAPAGASLQLQVQPGRPAAETYWRPRVGRLLRARYAEAVNAKVEGMDRIQLLQSSRTTTSNGAFSFRCSHDATLIGIGGQSSHQASSPYFMSLSAAGICCCLHSQTPSSNFISLCDHVPCPWHTANDQSTLRPFEALTL
ncbi:hypothetical protein G7K_6202-t1 [Saitoella complicata NRRL Y-17804]|uniref:Uncharacterized protein n=1 Tax=Saitoella complicata (strain BCRC 22490 / CBS 7301 / JCM 7358 / NBRC 10748 / NRRL Y-17804) TaxID=698492 RepID=A0A0E9NR22_SAICN|nr:hypothetical protein G7K_6202-t1 [Saitoella complicata NRRL Y-17804]